MLELLVYVFFAVAIAVGVIVTVAVWAVVVGWIIAGCLIVVLIVGIVIGVLNIWDRMAGGFRDWKRRRENRKRFPGTIAS